jgi:drug/metabolite transporter (DMT)-like permease
MTWLWLAVAGMVLWSATAVFDRYALNGRVTSIKFYLTVPALLQFPLVLLLFPIFWPTDFTAKVIIFGLLAGLVEAFFIYYMYTAMSREEVTRVFPLMSLGTFFTLLGGWFLLGDTLTQNQLIAMLLLTVGGVVIAFKRDQAQGRYGISKGLLYLLLAMLLASAYTLSLRFVFIESDFATGFFFSRVGFFLGGIILLFVFREEIIEQWEKLQGSMKALILGNHVVVFAGHALYFSALSLAAAALVQSVLSIQSIIVFVFALVVAKINPNWISESVTRHDLIQKSIAILLIVIALNLL